MIHSFDGTWILLHYPKNVQALNSAWALPNLNSMEHPGTDGEAGILRRSFSSQTLQCLGYDGGVPVSDRIFGDCRSDSGELLFTRSSVEQSNACGSRIANVVAASDSGTSRPEHFASMVDQLRGGRRPNDALRDSLLRLLPYALKRPIRGRKLGTCPIETNKATALN